MKLSRKQHAPGFTLIEVLIALVILAIALLAVIKVTQDSINNATHVRNNLIAHWVGMNVISEVQVGLLAMPQDGEVSTGQQMYLGKRWQWRLGFDAASTQPSYRSVYVSVSQAGHPYAHLIGFITR